MANRVPKGWSLVYSGGNQATAINKANEYKRKGVAAKVIAEHDHRLLSGQSVTNYITVVHRDPSAW